MSRTPNMLAARAERHAAEWRRQHAALFHEADLAGQLRASIIRAELAAEEPWPPQRRAAEAAHARQLESVCGTCGSRAFNGICALCGAY